MPTAKRVLRVAAICATAITVVACDESLMSPELPSGSVIVSLAAGDAHACGVDASGAAYCWGSNTSDQLGTDAGRTSSVPLLVREVPSFTTIVAGGAHTCALTVDGAAWCWGANTFGQLGRGTRDGEGDPAAVAGSSRFVDIDAGFAHTCAVTTDRTLMCWGYNGFGQLGTGRFENRNEPTAVAGAVQAIDVATGHTHSCAVSATGAAYCWGGNDRAQLGIGHQITTPVPAQVGGPDVTFAAITAGFESSCAIVFDGGALCWGEGRFGQLGSSGAQLSGAAVYVDTERRFERIDGGPGRANCGVSADAVLCWGDLPGSAAISHVPIRPVPPEPALAEVAVGNDFACALDAGGAVYCWGAGWSGQLGDGRYHATTAPVAVETR